MVDGLILLFTLFKFYHVDSQDSKIDKFASSLIIMIIIIIIIIIILRVFPTSVSRWFLTECHQISLSLLVLRRFGDTVFWTILIKLLFRWFPLILLFPSPLVLLPILCDWTKISNYNGYHRLRSTVVVFFN